MSFKVHLCCFLDSGTPPPPEAGLKDIHIAVWTVDVEAVVEKEGRQVSAFVKEWKEAHAKHSVLIGRGDEPNEGRAAGVVDAYSAMRLVRNVAVCVKALLICWNADILFLCLDTMFVCSVTPSSTRNDDSYSEAQSWRLCMWTHVYLQPYLRSTHTCISLLSPIKCGYGADKTLLVHVLWKSRRIPVP